MALDEPRGHEVAGRIHRSAAIGETGAYGRYPAPCYGDVSGMRALSVSKLRVAYDKIESHWAPSGEKHQFKAVAS
jgi:hypothetical protein